MDGVPGQFFPTHPSSAAQIRYRAMLINMPTTSPRTASAPRLLRRASRDGSGETTSVSGAETARQTQGDRRLRVGDVLGVLTRLLARDEIRAAKLLVHELASSDLAATALNSTLSVFNCQLVDFVDKHSDELSKVACDFIKRRGKEESGTKPVVEAEMRKATSNESKASARSTSCTNKSMRNSVLDLCRRVRQFSTRAAKVDNFTDVTDGREDREAFACDHKSGCSISRSESHTRTSTRTRYSCSSIMIEASNRQRQARAQSYDKVVPSESSTRCQDSFCSDGRSSSSSRQSVRHKGVESVDSALEGRSFTKCSCSSIMIEASNRQRQARAQSYDKVVPSGSSTRCQDSFCSDGRTILCSRQSVRQKGVESVDSKLDRRSFTK